MLRRRQKAPLLSSILFIVLVIVLIWAFQDSTHTAIIVVMSIYVIFLLIFGILYEVEKNREVIQNKSYKNIPDFDNMNGKEFEEFCGELLKGNGFKDIKMTKTSGDQGIDIIAKKNNVKYGIQCKRYKSNIGNQAIQQVYSGIRYYGCDQGVVLTNQYFTKSAKELAKTEGILMWDRGKLYSLIDNVYEHNAEERPTKKNKSVNIFRDKKTKDEFVQSEIDDCNSLILVLNTTTDKKIFEETLCEVKDKLEYLSTFEKEKNFSTSPSNMLKNVVSNESIYRSNLEKRIKKKDF